MFIRFWHLVTVISGSFCVYDLVHSWVFSRVSFFSCSTCAKWLILLRPCLWPSLLKACSLVFSRIFSFLYPIGSFCWRATCELPVWIEHHLIQPTVFFCLVCFFWFSSTGPQDQLTPLSQTTAQLMGLIYSLLHSSPSYCLNIYSPCKFVNIS